MAIVPRYFCDHCGFAFTHPRTLGWFGVRGRDEHDEDERCPRCASPDFELLQNENEEEQGAIVLPANQ